MTARVPGMVSFSQYAHFLSKKKSCSAQTINVGTDSLFNSSWMATVCLLSKPSQYRWKASIRSGLDKMGSR